MMKNGILTFLFAFCPGAGQMYQGYMKRGLSLITMFCVAFGAGTLLEVLYVAMPIVWMYSFFDTFNLRAQIGAGTAPQDDYLVHINWHDQRMEQFMLDSHKLLGWGLIAVEVASLKKLNSSWPHIRKTAKLSMPLPRMSIRLLNTAQYTRHISSGLSTLHTTPRTLRRYLSLKSRLTRFHSR